MRRKRREIEKEYEFTVNFAEIVEECKGSDRKAEEDLALSCRFFSG